MDFYIAEIPYQAVVVFGVVSAAFGLWRGGRDGSIVGLVILGQFAVSQATPGPNPYWVGATEDLVTLAICLVLVLTGRNYWTIVAAATQLLSLTTQALRVTTALTEWGYYSAQRTWFLLLIASVLVGSLPPRGRRTAAQDRA